MLLISLNLGHRYHMARKEKGIDKVITNMKIQNPMTVSLYPRIDFSVLLNTL